MKRRAFMKVSAGGAGVHTLAGCAQPRDKGETSGEAEGAVLAGMSLEKLRRQYRYDLFDDFLPFMDKHVIDHELGGFMCSTDRDGTNLSTTKRSWFEGRGIWVYSFLFNKVEPDQRYLDVAGKSVDFIMKHRPAGDAWWPGEFTREGKVLSAATDIYSSLFIANGLQEYSKAPGNERYWDIAKDILEGCMRRYDSPGYEYAVTYAPVDIPIQAPRVLGHWMVLLRLATQMLEHRSDPFVEDVAARSVEAIMERHFNPDFGLMNEVLDHDLRRPGNDYARFSYLGHAIETLWMVLYEADRCGDSDLFDTAAERFRRHVEVAWDDVYGGAFRSLDNVDGNEWKLDKVLWLQEEILIGTLFVIEHARAPWAEHWFEKTWTYVREKFPLAQYGYPLWILSADRKVTFEEHTSRVGNFHHPRHLMLNLLTLDRMMEREATG